MNKYEKITYAKSHTTINGLLVVHIEYEMYEEDYYKMKKYENELVERATPMKPSDLKDDDYVWWQCPKCNGDTTDDNQIQYNFCPICGQALDWSE